LLLSQKQRREEQLWPGELVRILFTFLDDTVYPLLARYFLSTADLSLEMVRTELVVSRVLATTASGELWAGCASFEEIHEGASEENTTFSFDFSAPTFFKRGGGPAYPDLTVPLPLPELVFGSLLQNWNRFSTMAFNDAALIKDLSAHHMEVSHWRGGSESARLVFRNGKGAYQTVIVPGFVGRCSFRLVGSHDRGLIKALNALANFAFYSGVGAKTTMGFGVSRRLDGPPVNRPAG
jgi:CRISPR-associated endoribonuclease Cas6